METMMEEMYDNHERVIIHIDIDCFYAQVEMLRNPVLQNKPVGVRQKSIVVTCNYMAREHGVKKCMLISVAKKLCPHLILVNGEDLLHYREYSAQVHKCLLTFSAKVEKLGLDENFIDVTHLIHQHSGDSTSPPGVYRGTGSCNCGCTQRISTGANIAQKIRHQILTQTGLTVCAGISSNKLIAKLASSLHKPNNQTCVYPDYVPTLLEKLTLNDLPGIGTVTANTLKSLNITTILQLQESSIDLLNASFGKETGDHLKQLSYGIDESDVKCSGPPQSIGVEDACRISSVEEFKEKLNNLLHKLIPLALADKRLPGTVKLTVRPYSKNYDSNRISKQTPVSIRSLSLLEKDGAGLLIKVLSNVFSKMIDTHNSFQLSLLGVAFTNLQTQVEGKHSILSYCKDVSTSPSDARSEQTPPSKRIKLDLQMKPGTIDYFMKSKSELYKVCSKVELDDSHDGSGGEMKSEDEKLLELCHREGYDLGTLYELPQEVRRQLLQKSKPPQKQTKNTHSIAKFFTSPNT